MLAVMLTFTGCQFGGSKETEPAPDELAGLEESQTEEIGEVILVEVGTPYETFLQAVQKTFQAENITVHYQYGQNLDFLMKESADYTLLSLTNGQSHFQMAGTIALDPASGEKSVMYVELSLPDENGEIQEVRQKMEMTEVSGWEIGDGSNSYLDLSFFEPLSLGEDAFTAEKDENGSICLTYKDSEDPYILSCKITDGYLESMDGYWEGIDLAVGPAHVEFSHEPITPDVFDDSAYTEVTEEEITGTILTGMLAVPMSAMEETGMESSATTESSEEDTENMEEAENNSEENDSEDGSL